VEPQRCLRIFYGVRSYQHDSLSVVHDISFITDNISPPQSYNEFLRESYLLPRYILQGQTKQLPIILPRQLQAHEWLVNLPSHNNPPIRTSEKTAQTLIDVLYKFVIVSTSRLIINPHHCGSTPQIPTKDIQDCSHLICVGNHDFSSTLPCES
jgi:hypothetical protein